MSSTPSSPSPAMLGATLAVLVGLALATPVRASGATIRVDYTVLLESVSSFRETQGITMGSTLTGMLLYDSNASNGRGAPGFVRFPASILDGWVQAGGLGWGLGFDATFGSGFTTTASPSRTATRRPAPRRETR